MCFFVRIDWTKKNAVSLLLAAAAAAAAGVACLLGVIAVQGQVSP